VEFGKFRQFSPFLPDANQRNEQSNVPKKRLNKRLKNGSKNGSEMKRQHETSWLSLLLFRAAFFRSHFSFCAMLVANCKQKTASPKV